MSSRAVGGEGDVAPASTPQSESGSVAAGSGSSKKLPKNAPRNRSDIAWNHGISVDGNTRKIKCKYCEKVITAGGGGGFID